MMNDILRQVYFGNTVLDYLTSAGIFLVAVLALVLVKNLVIVRCKKHARKTANTIDDFLVRIMQRTVMPLLYLGALYVAVQHLIVPASVTKVIDTLSVVILTVMVIRFAVAFIDFGLVRLLLRESRNDARERSLKSVASVIKIILWGLGVVFLMDNLGFQVSAIIAGLGIGGIAVGFAAQAILGDMFSFFAILFDRPFEIGDFVIIGDYLGAVEHIGIKTTRIRSLGGEQLIFSNTDLTNSRVRNYKRMAERRVVFKLGVTYQTPHAKMQKIPGIIKDIIQNVKNTRFDRAHFFSYGDFSLVFEMVYYVLSPDYNKYMDIQQEINLAIMQAFEREKIQFAYPTQTLYVNKGE